MYAFLKRRPITKFTKASDIPNQFIRDKVVQSGFVRKIEPTENGPVLLVNHKPPLNLALTSRALPIKVGEMKIINSSDDLMTPVRSFRFAFLGGWSTHRWQWVQLVANARD